MVYSTPLNRHTDYDGTARRSVKLCYIHVILERGGGGNEVLAVLDFLFFFS